MGWGRTLLLGDIGNRLDIADAESDIAALRERLHVKEHLDLNQEQRLERLESDVDEIKLCLATLSRLLVTRGVLAADDLAKLSVIIDEEGATS